MFVVYFFWKELTIFTNISLHHIWGHVRVNIFNQPISDEPTNKNQAHTARCCQIGRYDYCLAYDWMFKDE